MKNCNEFNKRTSEFADPDEHALRQSPGSAAAEKSDQGDHGSRRDQEIRGQVEVVLLGRVMQRHQLRDRRIKPQP
jgi:hypothetical protein